MRTSELIPVLSALGRPRILVIGDLVLDRYVTGDVDRISPEAPIAVLHARAQEERLGGAGNVAANLRAMEAEAEVVGIVGEDGRGKRLKGMLEAIGVETSGVLADGSRPTTEKTRLVSGVQQMLRVDWEDPRAISGDLAGRIASALEPRLRTARAVVLSDYGKGVLTPEILTAAIALARAQGVPILVDPKGSDFRRYRGATLVTPNRREAEEALGRRLADLADLPQAARDLIASAELDAAVITLGAQGMFHLARNGESGHVPTMARAVFDVTGAGDTVIAHLALGLGAGLPLPVAVHLANHAAGIVVGKRGAASVTREELAQALELAVGGGARASSKILRGVELERALEDWRGKKRRIVMTNGCFDLVHAGHIDYLRFARSKGDVLIVAVNDDASVRRLKGDGRPLNGLEDRMAVLAGLEMVDGVVSFPEDTPLAIVQRVTPQVLVKGEDWRDKGVVGREWVESHGGEVVLAPLLQGRSTSALLDKARERKGS